MRRGEMAVLALLAAGFAMWLAPSRRNGPAPHAEAEATWTTALAESARPPAPMSPGASAAVADRKIGLEDYDFDPKAATRLRLPERLKEISGLALAPDGRLLAHNDEQGLVFQIDYAKGEVGEAFELSDSRGRLDDDFEGIAVAEGSVYLVTSDGRVCEAAGTGAGGRVPCLVYDTGLGKEYEIEGMAYDPGARALLLASKTARGDAAQGPLYLFRWSIETKRLVAGAATKIPVKEIAERIRGDEFEPSGIERQPVSGNYFLVAGRQHALAEITPDGALVDARELPAEWHRQAEGITFAADQSLILSDEGAAKRGRLTVYPLRPR